MCMQHKGNIAKLQSWTGSTHLHITTRILMLGEINVSKSTVVTSLINITSFSQTILSITLISQMALVVTNDISIE